MCYFPDVRVLEPEGIVLVARWITYKIHCSMLPCRYNVLRQDYLPLREGCRNSGSIWSEFSRNFKFQCFALAVTVQLEPSPCLPLKVLPLQLKELDLLSVNGVMNHLRREHNSSSWKIKIGKILEDMSVLGVDSIIFVKQKEFSKVLHVCFLVHFLSPFPNELIHKYR